MSTSIARPEGALRGPAYTLSASGTELLFELGAQACDENGRRIAPVDYVLETDSRHSDAKHKILELYIQHGLELPDTPTMALRRGASICWNSISTATLSFCAAPFRLRRSIHQNSAATKIHSPHSEHRWQELRSYTCA